MIDDGLHELSMIKLAGLDSLRHFSGMTKLDDLKQHLKPGRAYRRAQLARWSTSVDRHLKQLVETGVLRKLSGGLYAYPKETAFGPAPAADKDVVRAFLKDDRFLLASPNAYNSLGLGTTQLYDKTVVYNHKRHGEFQLGGRKFAFRVKPRFPKALTEEFLLVDLVNNLGQLAEAKDEVLQRAMSRAVSSDSPRLRHAVREYGNERTKKLFERALNGVQSRWNCRNGEKRKSPHQPGHADVGTGASRVQPGRCRAQTRH